MLYLCWYEKSKTISFASILLRLNSSLKKKKDSNNVIISTKVYDYCAIVRYADNELKTNLFSVRFINDNINSIIFQLYIKVCYFAVWIKMLGIQFLTIHFTCTQWNFHAFKFQLLTLMDLKMMHFMRIINK